MKEIRVGAKEMLVFSPDYFSFDYIIWFKQYMIGNDNITPSINAGRMMMLVYISVT